jgi:hypothetical protein
VRIKLLNLAELPFNANATLKDIPYNQAEQKRFATEVNRIRKVDTIYHPEWTINLDEVTVRAQRLLKKEKRENDLKQTYKERGLFYSASSKKLYMEDLPAGGAIYKDVYEVIQAKIPGANVTRTDEGRQVLLRGQSSIQNPTYASIELNGALISPLAAEAIIPELIEVIDIKRGLYSTAVYGEAGNGGVISIITRDPQKTSRKVHVAGILQVDHPGYHKARTFYAPDYNDPSEDKDKPNYRTCLYWNPDAALDNQPTPVQFFTGDKLSEFLIIVEGISETGLPFVGHQSIQVGK